MKFGKDLRRGDIVYTCDISVDIDEEPEADDQKVAVHNVASDGHDRLWIADDYVQTERDEKEPRQYVFCWPVQPELQYAENPREAIEQEIKNLKDWAAAYQSAAEIASSALKRETRHE